MYPESFRENPIPFHATDAVFNFDSRTRNCFVFQFLFICQRCPFGLFVRDKHFFALVILLKPLITQIQSDFQIFKPSPVRRELSFQNGIIVCLAYVNLTQEVDSLVFRADDQRFGGMGFFLPL